MNQQLVNAFHRAALFLIKHMKEDGWIWSSNYLREHVRCANHLKFTNSLSPQILRELVRQHPEMKCYVVIDKLKKRK